MYRLGIVDFDSSHCVEFTRRFNHVGMDADQIVEGARVTLGCPGTSLMSPERVPLFTQQMRAIGIELVEQPEEMIGRVDAVLVLSVCGAPHLERVSPFLKAGIPAFVDKPMACNLADATAMYLLAQQHNVSLWSSSGMRFATEILDFPKQEKIYGKLSGAMAYGPAKRAPGNPGLLHYGIHAIEILCTLMGPGCQSVTAIHTASTDVVTAIWKDGRLGTVRGLRDGSTAYGFTAFCEHGVIPQAVSARYSYRNLCQNIVQTLQLKVPPVTSLQTLEVIAFALAALQSEQSGGQMMEIEKLLQKP
jgi:virulence factor